MCSAQAHVRLPPIATLIAFFGMSGLGHKRTSHRLFDHFSARSAGKSITTAQAHPHRIITRSDYGQSEQQDYPEKNLRPDYSKQQAAKQSVGGMMPP